LAMERSYRRDCSGPEHIGGLLMTLGAIQWRDARPNLEFHEDLRGKWTIPTWDGLRHSENLPLDSLRDCTEP